MRAILFLLLAAWISFAHAGVVAVVEAVDGSVTLTNEPCELPAVANLPYMAIWKEGDKTYSGCWEFNPEYGVVVSYFEDRKFALIPQNLLRKPTEL